MLIEVKINLTTNTLGDKGQLLHFVIHREKRNNSNIQIIIDPQPNVLHSTQGFECVRQRSKSKHLG